MRIPIQAKRIAYLCATAVLLWLAWWFGRGLAGEGAFEAHRRATLYLFALGCTFLGGAVYGWRAYIRRHREHAADALLWLLTGLLTLGLSVYTFVSFTGEEAGLGLMRTLLWLPPVPITVRTVTVLLSRRGD